MKKGLVLCFVMAVLFNTVEAANIYAGKNTVQKVCSQCHGMKMPAEGAPFPPLARRDRGYLEMAIKQYRNKVRISDIMNNIAGSLTDKQIADIAAFYSRLTP
jgi:cytochrome c553